MMPRVAAIERSLDGVPRAWIASLSCDEAVLAVPCGADGWEASAVRVQFPPGFPRAPATASVADSPLPAVPVPRAEDGGARAAVARLQADHAAALPALRVLRALDASGSVLAPAAADERAASPVRRVALAGGRACADVRWTPGAAAAAVGAVLGPVAPDRRPRCAADLLLLLAPPLADADADAARERFECGVCAAPLTVRAPPGLPDVACASPLCAQQYHADCLRAWRALLPKRRAAGPTGSVQLPCPKCGAGVSLPPAAAVALH